MIFLRLRRAAVSCCLLAAAVLAWAMFWPDASCAQPGCAKRRYLVAVEVDAFRDVAPIELEQKREGRIVSLRNILAAGGIGLAIELDQKDVPYSRASGPLDRADLYQYAAAWRNNHMPKGAEAKVYAMLTPALVSDTGEPVFGIMFDTADREGFAVAPGTTERSFRDREPDSIAILQLRTFAHELLHALNRRHLDAAQMEDGRLTIEAPTRCIAGHEQGRWFLHEQPLMEISPGTIRFFQSALPTDILPGRKSSAYEGEGGSPAECEEARANSGGDPAHNRWQLATRRLRALLSFQSAIAAENQPRARDATSELKVGLAIQALDAPYPLGYPIAIRIVVKNNGPKPLPLRNRLSPAFGMIEIDYRERGAPNWQRFQPLAWFEPTSDEAAMLPPGETTEQTVPIYFGEAGWTIASSGEYEVRALLHSSDADLDVRSEPVVIRVTDPQADDDRAVLQPLLDATGTLDGDVGRLLTFGGRIGSEEHIAPLEAAAAKYGHTALGAALRLTLISQQLRPPIDPLTGERPSPDLTQARKLLEDTCTDSGVAALKYQLLQRHTDEVAMSNRAETPQAAWDGTTSLRGTTMPTYSDPALHAWGPTVHFCLDEAALRASATTDLLRLARQLRRLNPTRVVVVGHGDHSGTCRHNDVLGLARATNVRQALVGAGIRASRVVAASLGERRPLDFSSTESARALNRRIEILVEGVDGAQRGGTRILAGDCQAPSQADAQR